MKHEEVVAALKSITDTGKASHLSTGDLNELKSYNLVAIAEGEESKKNPGYILTKKGRVMLKANSK